MNRKYLFLLLIGYIIPYVLTLSSSSSSSSPSKATASFTRYVPHSAPRTRGAIQYYLQQHYNVSFPTQIIQHNAFASTLSYEIQLTVMEWDYVTVALQLHVEETCAQGCFIRIQAEPAWTQVCVKQALHDIEYGMLATPRLLQRQMLFSFNDTRTAPNVTSHTWRQFVWNEGGGLLLPFPPLVGQHKRILLPPGLVESIRTIKMQEIRYQVDNPGWLALYPVYTHTGRVRLLPRKNNPRHAMPDTILLDWQVQVRPYSSFWSRQWVEWVTETMVVTVSRNFLVHCTEPNEVVNVLAPIGQAGAFWTLRKDSWLGGVWEAKRTDQRAFWVQLFDLCRPWTWGRSYDLPHMNATTTWSDGFIHE